MRCWRANVQVDYWVKNLKLCTQWPKLSMGMRVWLLRLLIAHCYPVRSTTFAGDSSLANPLVRVLQALRGSGTRARARPESARAKIQRTRRLQVPTTHGQAVSRSLHRTSTPAPAALGRNQPERASATLQHQSPHRRCGQTVLGAHPERARGGDIGAGDSWLDTRPSCAGPDGRSTRQCLRVRRRALLCQ